MSRATPRTRRNRWYRRMKAHWMAKAPYTRQDAQRDAEREGTAHRYAIDHELVVHLLGRSDHTDGETMCGIWIEPTWNGKLASPIDGIYWADATNRDMTDGGHLPYAQEFRIATCAGCTKRK